MLEEDGVVVRDILSHGLAALASSSPDLACILVRGLWADWDYLSAWTGVSRPCLAHRPTPLFTQPFLFSIICVLVWFPNKG